MAKNTFKILLGEIKYAWSFLNIMQKGLNPLSASVALI